MKRLLLISVLCACSPPEAKPPVPGVSRLENLSVAESYSGTARWRLKAEGSRMEEKRGLIFFTKPRIIFYESGLVASEITALEGEMQMREKAAELSGDVKVNARKDGMRLATSKLYYSAARGKIWTREPVVIHKDRTVITGSGFTANPDLSEIEITRQETRMSDEK